MTGAGPAWAALNVKRSESAGALLPAPALLEMLQLAQGVEWQGADADQMELLRDLLTQAAAEIERLLALLSAVEACPEAQPMTEAARWRFVLLTRFTLAMSRLRMLRDQAEERGITTSARAYDTALQVVMHEQAAARQVGQSKEQS